MENPTDAFALGTVILTQCGGTAAVLASCSHKLCGPAAAPVAVPTMPIPSASGLLQEIKDNTQHYISVIAEAADSQLSTLSRHGHGGMQTVYRHAAGGGEPGGSGLIAPSSCWTNTPAALDRQAASKGQQQLVS